MVTNVREKRSRTAKDNVESSKSKISKSIGKSTVQDKQVSSLEEEQLGKRRRPAPGALASRNVTGARERRSEAATLDLLSKEGARGRKRKQPEGVQNDAVEPVTGVPQDRQQKPERVSNRNDAITESKGQQVQGRSIIQRAGRGTSAAPCKNAKTPAKIISSQIHDQHSAPSNTLGSADDLQRQQLVQGTPCRGSKSFQKGQVKGQKKTGTFKDAALRAGQQASSGSGGSRVGARSRPAVARDVLRFGAEEAEKSEQQIAAHPSTTSPSTAGHTKEHMAHAPHSEAVAGKTGKPERSPTPVAAAAVLEMSRPASPVQEPRAEHIPAALDQDPSYAANTWLMSRLRDPRSKEAQGGALRPQLRAVHEQLISNLENTIELGHNNSVLVLGPRGSGKTLVVERALGDVCAKYNTSVKNPLVAVVRLLGYAHADERVAFREIARQLVEQFGGSFLKSASEADNIKFLMDILKQLKRSHKVAVFVLDDFDLFARRSKQMVLYNLLDALVTSGMQAAVLGLTPRHDVIEMLEKRVKSRFSHRKLTVTLPTSLRPWQRGEGLSLQQEDGMLDVLKCMLLLPPAFPHRQHAARFNRAVEEAVASAEVAEALDRALPSCPTLDHMALVVESALRASHTANGLVTSCHLVEALGELLLRHKDMVAAVSQLSVLELILLVAMQRLASKHQGEAMNLEMVYYEFKQYATQGGHADNYSRGAAAKAFDHLITQGLVAYVDSRSEGRAGARQYAAVYLQVSREEVEAGLKEHCTCPPPLMLWLTRQAGAGNTAATVLL